MGPWYRAAVEGDEANPAARPETPDVWEVADRATKQRASELAEFRARLAALTPRVVVTPLLVAANVLVFAIMVVRGVSPLSPTTENLLAWGANYGRLSASGEWWRLATAMFLHVGVIHLLMNMWVLWDAGPLVERMLGHVAFASAYLLAGLAGSCASALWSPDRPSAGASGAIFGIFGVLGAFLLRQRHALPPGALTRLTRSSLFFVGYNVIYGLTNPSIDMAAHLGGLAGGFVVGLPLVHALTPEARARTWRRAAVVTAVGLAAGGALWSRAPRLLARRAELSLGRFELPGASLGFPAGADRKEHHNYDAGKIRSDLTGAGYVLLNWSTNEMMTDTEQRRTLESPRRGHPEAVGDGTDLGGDWDDGRRQRRASLRDARRPRQNHLHDERLAVRKAGVHPQRWICRCRPRSGDSRQLRLPAGPRTRGEADCNRSRSRSGSGLRIARVAGQDRLDLPG